MSIAKGFLEAAQETHDHLKANTLQIFLKSPRGRGTTKLTDQEAKRFKEYAQEKRIQAIVAHSSYLLNFAKPLAADRWDLHSLTDDLKSMAKLNGIGVVLHTGKTLLLDYNKAENYIVQNLKQALKETSALSTFILLENMAGQGTEMGSSFEQLGSLFKKLEQHPRIGFCFDTCHAFAAGYDLSTQKGVENVLKEFDKHIGIRHLKVMHFNDSKYPLGSRRDRHANLGEGEIGLEGLQALAQWATKHVIPMILETPERHGKNHLDDIQILKHLAKGGTWNLKNA